MIATKSYVCEVEDIIEACDMTFAEGTIFKSLIRLCKLRSNLGKPGSNSVYEAEKINYYANRLLVISQRKDMGNVVNIINFDYYKVHVPYPKRIDPYVCDIRDIVEALNMTSIEGILINLIKLCRCRYNSVKEANIIVDYTKQLLDITKHTM